MTWLDIIKICADDSPEKSSVIREGYDHRLLSGSGIYRRTTREGWLPDACALYVDSSCFREDTAVHRVAKAVAETLKICDYDEMMVVVFSDEDCISTEFELHDECDFGEISIPEERATGIAPALEHFSDECLDDTTRLRIIVTTHEPAEDFREDYDYNLVPTVIVRLTSKASSTDDDTLGNDLQNNGPILLKIGRKEFLCSVPEL